MCKYASCPDIAPILLITDVLQQTNGFFTLHKFACFGIDHTGVGRINQLVLIENMMLAQPFLSIKIPKHPTATKIYLISVPKRFLQNFNTRYTAGFALILDSG